MLGHFVESRINYLALYRPFHIRNFFGTLVNKQYEQFDFLVIGRNGICYFFQKRSFARFRRRYYHSSLSFSDRSYQIKTSYRKVASRYVFLLGINFKTQSFLRKDRRKVVKMRTGTKIAEVLARIAHVSYGLILARLGNISSFCVFLIYYLVFKLGIYPLYRYKRGRLVVRIALCYAYDEVACS